jgi:hypothetical protein
VSLALVYLIFSLLFSTDTTTLTTPTATSFFTGKHHWTMKQNLTNIYARYVAESGVALWVGNLPLCWPVLRLALGSKGDSSNPSYANPSYRNSSYPENSARRRTQGRNKPSVWAKLEDEDGARTDGSPDHGSQIELVEQYGQQPYFVEAKASSDAHKVETGTNGHITVVTKVEVSEGRL